MFLLKYINYVLVLFVCLIFPVQGNSLENLRAYYNSILDKKFFYYESNIVNKQEYTKLLQERMRLDLNDIITERVTNRVISLPTIDFVILTLNKEGSKDSYDTVIYKEIEENTYIGVVKFLSSANDNKEVNITRKSYMSLNKEANNLCYVMPKDYIVLNYIDYIIVNYNCYDFDIVKITPTNIFYKGTVKESSFQLFEEININFSKEYSIPLQVNFIDNNDVLSITVDELENIAGEYIVSKYSAYNDGVKSVISRKKIVMEIPIEIENHNYQISFDEYINLINISPSN